MGKHRLVTPRHRGAARVGALALLVPGVLAVVTTPALAGTGPKPKPQPQPPSYTEAEENCNGIAACVDAVDSAAVDSLLEMGGVGSGP